MAMNSLSHPPSRNTLHHRSLTVIIALLASGGIAGCRSSETPAPAVATPSVTLSRSKVPLGAPLPSILAPRAYGQVATAHLEELEAATETEARAYATHFRITGRTCSLLMLESELDYERFGIKPDADAYVVKASPAADLFARAIKATYGLRVSAEEEEAGLDMSEHGMYGYPEQFIPAPELVGYGAVPASAIKPSVTPTTQEVPA